MYKMPKSLEEAIERSTGYSIEFLRKTPICELRRIVEEKNGRPMEFTVNNPRFLSHQQVEKMFDESLGYIEEVDGFGINKNPKKKKEPLLNRIKKFIANY